MGNLKRTPPSSWEGETRPGEFHQKPRTGNPASKIQDQKSRTKNPEPKTLDRASFDTGLNTGLNSCVTVEHVVPHPIQHWKQIIVRTISHRDVGKAATKKEALLYCCLDCVTFNMLSNVIYLLYDLDKLARLRF